MAIETYLSIITLNVSGLNASTKRHRLAEWVQKQDPYICCLQKTHFRPKDTYRLKVRGWDNIFHANGKQKKSGVLLLLLSHFSRVRLCATQVQSTNHLFSGQALCNSLHCTLVCTVCIWGSFISLEEAKH